MVIKLYYLDVSPPVRSVLLTAKALDLELQLIAVDLLAGEHKSAEFKKLNPQSTLPTLDDNGFVLWESHCILIYLVKKYGKQNFLYSEELQQQSIIHQRLHFNSGVVQPRMRLILRRLFLGEINKIPEEGSQDIVNAYEVLEKFLETCKYMVGDSLSIADFSLVSSISSLDPIIPIEDKRFPKLKQWLTTMQKLPYYNEANQIPLNKYITVIKSKLIQ